MMQELGSGAVNAALRLLGLAFGGLALWFLYEERDGVLFALLGGGGCLLFSHLPAMQKLKLGPTGIEAEMKQVLEEAKASVDELHKLAAIMGAATVAQLAAEGRWGGGMTSAMKAELRQRIISSLKELGLPEKRIEEVGRADAPWVRFDYAGYAMKPIKYNDLNAEQKAQWQEEFKAHSFSTPLTPVQLRGIIERLGVLSNEVEERLQDYEHYCRTFTHRRPDVWSAYFQRDEVGS